MLNGDRVRLVCSLCGTGVVRELTEEERRRFSDNGRSCDDSNECEITTDCRVCHGLLLALLRRTDRRRGWLHDGPKYGRLAS